MDEKWKRDDVVRLFTRFSDLSYKEVRAIVQSEQNYKLYDTITRIAEYAQQRIVARQLNLRPIVHYEKYDPMSQKTRDIGVEEPMHQIFNYVAVIGLKELFDAKIGVFQCASLPGKGQSYGKKYIERWIQEPGTKYFWKGDIRQCFPSIPHDKLKALLAKYVKNDTLLWLVFELIDMFGTGLSIGSYLSQYLSNFYLSFAYHYASEQLYKIRRTKRNGDMRVRLAKNVLFYMDDILLMGSSKKDLSKGIELFTKYVYDFLGLEIKPQKICKISESEPIDVMGFVFRKDRATIRAKIFLRGRRNYLEADKCLRNKVPIPEKLARRCISAYGWFKHTDSYEVRKRLRIDEIFAECKKVVSQYDKERSRMKYAAIIQANTA